MTGGGVAALFGILVCFSWQQGVCDANVVVIITIAYIQTKVRQVCKRSYLKKSFKSTIDVNATTLNLTALETGLVAPTLTPPLVSKGEWFEDVSDRVELVLCTKCPLTSGVEAAVGGKGVSPFISGPWWGGGACAACCSLPWGLTIKRPPPDWIWDRDNTNGGWWWPICNDI